MKIGFEYQMILGFSRVLLNKTDIAWKDRPILSMTTRVARYLSSMWHPTIRNPPIPDCHRINGHKKKLPKWLTRSVMMSINESAR